MSNPSEINFKLRANDRQKPTPEGQNLWTGARADRYGGALVQSLWGSKLHGLADEGSVFVATNPTPGTAIAGIAAADGLDDLEALVFLRFGASSSKRLYLLWLELEVVAVGTSGTNFAYAIKVDKGNSRYASGGSSITPKNVNAADATATEVDRFQFGAVVPTAATSEARLVDHGRLRTVIKVAGDKYRFVFGDSSPGTPSGIPTEGTLQSTQVINCPPVILGGGDSMLLHEFAASQSVAASYQFKACWVER